MLVCPNCLHPNPAQSTQCELCRISLTEFRACPGCSVLVPAYAKFCYQCGASLNTEHVAIPATPTRQDAVMDPTNDPTEEGGITHLEYQAVRFLHTQSSSFLRLPAGLEMIDIGKSSKTTIPHLDVKHLPESQIVSRNHARILVDDNDYYIEDLGSTNGTFINKALLPLGKQHRLKFGDRITFGSGDRFTLVFIQDQPVDLEHLKHISGGDRALEQELMQSYLEYAQISLQSLQTALLEKRLEQLEQTAEQLRIASNQVGAQVMRLLAEQLVTKAKGRAMSCSFNLISELEAALENLRLRVAAHY